MNTPQIIMTILIALNLLHEANRHGETKKDQEYNIFVAIVAKGIFVGLLMWGDFF